MSCACCGDDYSARSYCEKWDDEICENCYENMKEDACIDCDYKEDCEIYNSKSIDVEGYLQALKDCKNCDPKTAHIIADSIIISILRELGGYDEIIKAWCDVTSFEDK